MPSLYAVVSKSFPYVKGKPGPALPLSSMGAAARQDLRGALLKVKATRVERKIPVGPLRRGPNASVRTGVSRADAQRNHAVRLKAYQERQVAQPPAAVEVPKKRRLVDPNQALNAAASTTVAGGLGYAVHRRHQVAKSSRRTDAALGAGAGVAAGDAAYVVGGQAAKHTIRAYQNKHWTPAANKTLTAHKKSLGFAANEFPRGSTPHKLKDRFYTTYPTNVPGGRARRLLAYKNRRSVNAAALVATGAIGAKLATRRSQVTKSAGAEYALRHGVKVGLSHPKRIAAIATTGVGALGAEHVTDGHRRTREAEGAVGGGIAGWGAHQVAPYPVKWQARQSVQWNAKPSELNDRPALKKTVVAEQKMRGKWRRGHEAAGTWNNPASRMYRDFPAGHRRAKTMRAFGYTHGGRAGEAVSLASIAAGGALGVRAARHRAVSKGLISGLVPVVRFVGREIRVLSDETREFAASSPVVVTPGMREGVRRTAEATPRSFVYAGAARKGSGLVLMAHADRNRRD